MQSKIGYKCSVNCKIERLNSLGQMEIIKTFSYDNLLLNLGKGILAQRIFGITTDIPNAALTDIIVGDGETTPVEANTLTNFGNYFNNALSLKSYSSLNKTSSASFSIGLDEFNGYYINTIGLASLHTGTPYPFNRILLDEADRFLKQSDTTFSGTWILSFSEI
jgi:hypothetical protein